MYQKPQIERLGTLRELTQNGASFGVDFVDFNTDASAPTCNPNAPQGPSTPVGAPCGSSRGS